MNLIQHATKRWALTTFLMLQMFGLGLAKFFKDGFNIFDLMVVILSQVMIFPYSYSLRISIC